MNTRSIFRIFSSVSIVLCLLLPPTAITGQDLDEIHILLDDPELIQKALHNSNYSRPQTGLREMDFSFELIAWAEYDPSDYEAVWYPTEGSRGLCAGSDLDADGHEEIFAVHYGNGSGVIGFEMDDTGTLEMIWNSTTTAPTTYEFGTRFVQTGDLDGDGMGEVIFFRGRYSDDPNRGLYIYEWNGTNNGYDLAYHNTLMSLSGDLVSTITVEHFLINDVDEDGQQELIFASNGPSMGAHRSEDFFSILSISGDIGSGAEVLTEEFWISPRDVDRDGIIEDRLGGGSGMNVQVCDTDNDGLKEVFCHSWNYFNMFFFEAVGPDSYTLGDTTNIQYTYPSDDLQVMNSAVSDMDGDGADEIYIANFFTGEVYMIHDTDGDATSLLSSEVVVLGENTGAYFGAVAFDFDSSGTDEIYFGSNANTGSDLVAWDGEDFRNFRTDLDSDGFITKLAVGDMNGNGIPELISAHQGVNTNPERIIRISEYLPDDPSNSRWDFLQVYDVGYSEGWGNSYAPVLGDYDNNGYIDVFVTNGGYQQNMLHQNTGLGYFQTAWGEVTYNWNWTNSATWGDYDNDGFLDLFTANGGGGQSNVLYHNLGAGAFDIVLQGNIVSDNDDSRGASWADYDNDGFLDLYVANSLETNGTNSLFHNNGDGTFSQISVGWIVFDIEDSQTPSWCDYDNDGDLDMYVINCGANSLYRNEGDGIFTKIQTGILVEHGDCSTGASWADYDNDGDFDVFVTNGPDESNRLYHNDGEGVFTEITQGQVVTDMAKSWGSAWGDLDNDGDLDLFVANSEEPFPQDNFIYINNGDGSFIGVYDHILNENSLLAIGTAWGDYNNDGDLDLFVAIDGGPNELYANQGNGNSWVNIQCLGTVSNASAIGAKVWAKANYLGNDMWQVQEISGQTGAFGQNSLNVEFGFADAEIIDSLRIDWPSGLINEYTDVQVDEFYVVREGEALCISADTLDFGQLFLGGSSTMLVEFANLGPVSIQVADIASDNLAFVAEFESFELSPNDTLTMEITYSPSVTGTYEGLLTLISSDPLAPEDTILLYGEALLAPDIGVSTDSLLVMLLPGATETQTITIDNLSGESTLYWTASLELSGTDQTITFGKENYADWNLPENQDRITDDVWITRGDTRGIFNAALEFGYSHSNSPLGTEWAYGFSEDLIPEDYEVWINAVHGSPPDMVGNPISLHLIEEDIYLDLIFHSWSAGGSGGGFSYTRTATRAEWITLASDTGAIEIGGSVLIEVMLDATGLPSEMHYSTLVIHSNDPDESEIIIPVELEVSVAPDIYLEIDSLDFGNVFTGYADTLQLEVENWGSENLMLNGITTSLPEYQAIPLTAEIYPEGVMTLNVILSPSAPGEYNGTLILSSSDPDEATYTVVVLGSSIEPPSVGLTPDSLGAELYTGGIDVQNMVVSNTGLSDLEYEIRAVSVVIDQPDVAVIDAQLFNARRFSFRELMNLSESMPGLNGTSWGNRGKPGLRYTESESHNRLGTREIRELWSLLYTDPEENHSIDIQHIYGSHDDEELLFRIEEYADSDMIVCAVYIDIDQNMATGVNTSEMELGWTLGIDYAMISTGFGFDGFFVWDELEEDFREIEELTTNIIDETPYERIMGVSVDYFQDVSAFNFAILCESYEDDEDAAPDFGPDHIVFPLSTPWLSFEPEMGTIPAGSQQDVTVTFDASDMYGGEYYSDISVMSNDPGQAEIIARAFLNVTGIPAIGLGQSSLDFGNIFVDYEYTLEFELINTGTDSLHVSSITSANPALTIMPSTMDLHYGESGVITVSITPGTVGEFTTSIECVSDDPEQPSLSLPVTATMLMAPEIEVDQTIMSYTVYGQVELLDTLILGNTGGSDLIYNIHIEEPGPGRETGGPDAFGYSWKDSNEPNGPDYEWIDASGGTEIWLSDDDYLSGYSLGFDFVYYGIAYNELTIMSNGWVSFLAAGDHWYPGQVPYNEAWSYAGAIAPFGGDLYPPVGDVYILTTGSAPHRKTVVEYASVSWCCDGPPYMTFQVIFYEQSNRIRFQYQELQEQWPTSLGISNEDNSIGLGDGGVQETYIDPTLVTDNYAIEFSNQIDWIAVEPVEGTVEAGGELPLEIQIDTRELDNGYFVGLITIESNDPEASQSVIPVELLVTGVAVDEDGLIPDSYSLQQNYPNPFNPSTSIRYGLPENADANLVIYDILGRVRQEWNYSGQNAGWHEVTWNGTDKFGNTLGAGVYFARLVAGEYSQTVKMVYLR